MVQALKGKSVGKRLGEKAMIGDTVNNLTDILPHTFSCMNFTIVITFGSSDYILQDFSFLKILSCSRVCMKINSMRLNMIAKILVI